MQIAIELSMRLRDIWNYRVRVPSKFGYVGLTKAEFMSYLKSQDEIQYINELLCGVKTTTEAVE